jgi:hypothetical protein
MPELSPAAQAVLDAANGAQSYGPDDCLNESRWIAVAALRAVVQELKYFGVTEKNILAIADELEISATENQ